jgi:hypothetical protein
MGSHSSRSSTGTPLVDRHAATSTDKSGKSALARSAVRI